MSRTHLLMSLLLAAESAAAFSVRTDTLDLSCLQNNTAGNLQCTYQMSVPETITGISAAANGAALTIEHAETYPWDGAVTAVLILVDTSDPGRQNVVEENRRIIEQILGQAGPHNRIGLASFDKSLRLEAPVGATHAEILAAAGNLRALGMTTELYRSALSAIKILKNAQADRKTIYLMSDGLAEDKAYFQQDVVRAAREAGVVIIGLGFPRSVSQSVNLQTLRRLSDETGGVYFESDNNFHLPDEFLHSPFSSIDNGGRFSIDVENLIKAPDPTRKIIAIDIKTATGNNHVDIPLSVLLSGQEEPSAEQKPAVIAQPSVATTAPVTIITREAPAEPDYFWSWYLVLIGLIFLLIAVITAFFLMVYRQGTKKSGAANYAAVPVTSKPYAYLITQDENKKRYPITQTTWRIGRGSDNEMILQDNSISRRHAEIHRDKGDVFTLFDLDSLNGVFVNDKKVSKHVLHEGDTVEIGDIVLCFTLLSHEYQSEEPTLMQNTRSPLAH